MLPRHRVHWISAIATIHICLASSALSQPVIREGTIRLYQSSERVLVMMRIGDGELVPMVFDTGSDGHSFDRMVVRRNHLKQVGTTIEVDGTTGKRRTLPTFAIPSVSLGGLDVGSIEGVALDYDRNDAMGIISSEMFTGNLVSLELGRNQARILPKIEATIPKGPATPYQGALPSIDVTLPDGTNLTGDLDTGFNGQLSLPVSMMKSVPLIEPATVVGRFKSINTEGDVYGGQIRGRVQIGPIVLDNPHVTFLGDVTNIGLPIVRRLTLVLDPAEKRSWAIDCKSEAAASC